MTKLHEILAVENSLEATANKLIKESLHTLDKETLFKGQTRRLEMFSEKDKHLEITEHQELTTSVDENLEYLEKPISKWIDVILQKDKTNQEAKADLIIDNKTIAKDLPATFLLGMETKLTKIRNLYDKIPTLPPGIDWIKDENDKEGIFKNKNDTIQFKSHKEPDFIVTYEATKEHPAQVAQVVKNKDVGRYVISQKCGMMTPLEKANRISRIDKLLRAFKKARMRANTNEVNKGNIGKILFDYINRNVLSG